MSPLASAYYARISSRIGPLMRTPLLVALGLSTCLASVACDDGGSKSPTPPSPTADAGPLADGQPLDPFGVTLAFTEPLDGAVITTRARETARVRAVRSEEGALLVLQCP